MKLKSQLVLPAVSRSGFETALSEEEGAIFGATHWATPDIRALPMVTSGRLLVVVVGRSIRAHGEIDHTPPSQLTPYSPPQSDGQAKSPERQARGRASS